MTSPLLNPVWGTSLLTPMLSIPVTLFAPSVSSTALGDVDKQVMAFLAGSLLDGAVQTELTSSNLYYHGLNTVPSLGIAVPPELESLRAVLGWCGAAVDARSERLSVLGFRMPGETEVDDDLMTVWQANNLDSESALVHDDAMIYGRSFVVVGVGDNPDDPPLVTMESPTNMTASWDVRRREVSAAYHTYFDIDPASDTFNEQLATLYTRDATIHLVSGAKGWEVQDRNDHGQGFVPVVMFANRPRTNNRYGVSEIAAAWRNTQDRACRSLVSMEVAREFFAAMKVWLLGTSEQAFRKADGSIATAMETFIGRISAIEADAKGNLPQVIFQQGQDPGGMIRLLDHERQIMSGHTSLPPQFLGIFNDANPSSADAIRQTDFRLAKVAESLTRIFGNCWEEVARMALRVWQGSIPDGAERLETDWAPTGIPTPFADTQSMVAQIGAGMVPADADDVLAAVGWTPVQRARLEVERDDAAEAAAEVPAMPAVQAADGQQPTALMNLAAQRTTDTTTA